MKFKTASKETKESTMAAAGRRGKLSLKRNRNDDDKPSISFKKPALTPKSEVWERDINNSKVEPEMYGEDRLSR